MAHTGPVHGIVEATPAWVARRLDALAATLLLPCPARDAFLFPADVAFYDLCTTSLISLQQAARRVVEHLGLACDTVVVAFRSDLPNPARIEREGGHWFIEIAVAHRNDGPVLGAILAHECCHILLEERRVPRFDTAVDEVHVDLALMLAGLGALTLNAIEDRSVTTDHQTVISHRSFGYLRANLLRYAYAHVAASLRIGRIQALAPLRQTRSRDAVRWHLTTSLRARRSPLAYLPLASHVIIPCSSATCARRLRLPTGAVGKARCPECGASWQFDGRPFTISPRSAPAKMTTAPLPGNSVVERASRYISNMPGEARLSAAALLAIFGIIAGLWLKEAVDRAPLGGPCARATDCRSGQCVHASRESPFGDLPFGSPLANTGAGVCTQPCKTEQDCPSEFECVNAVSHEWRGFAGASPWGNGVPIRVCARP